MWKGDWSADEKLSPMEQIQLEQSDVISFHNYDTAPEFEKRIASLQRYDRPILCTEYMARGNGSTFQGSLPLAKQYNVGAINWGFVAGKTQTNLPWDSWQKPYVGREPTIWFHEVFQAGRHAVPARRGGVDSHTDRRTRGRRRALRCHTGHSVACESFAARVQAYM